MTAGPDLKTLHWRPFRSSPLHTDTQIHVHTQSTIYLGAPADEILQLRTYLQTATHILSAESRGTESALTFHVNDFM